jgi:hypothetical protein
MAVNASPPHALAGAAGEGRGVNPVVEIGGELGGQV